MKILIVRGYASELKSNMYNLQEVGLAKSIVKMGHECDIVYYTKRKNIYVETIQVGEKKINIYWTPGLKVLNNSIYLNLIKNKFFDKYDVIQSNEYNQIMTWILPKITKTPVIIYHGPYSNGEKLNHKIFTKIYDFLFLKKIIKSVDSVITKSKLASDYMKKKGFRNISTVGVGLDIDKFNKNSKNDSVESIIKNQIDKSKDKILLYVGRLDDDKKNIRFLIDIMKFINMKNKDVKLMLVGSCSDVKKKELCDYTKDNNLNSNIIFINSIKQDELPELYKLADVFVLPSVYEIFGMVILESMYFNLPVVSSVNGGSTTAIENNYNGIIIKEFDAQEWSEKIIMIINDINKMNELSRNAHSCIIEDFTWDNLAYKFINIYKKAIKDYD
ncbi:glycosyltransferase family 4 protein [Paraclostridium bifermentans]|uniref:glycosyltransferase family 4 protein n=1 Tax=Paraclostridium bifermentans TaxID=1490 RepID=UPI00241E91A1|nr:glycosyltransferase family 4 protein [Paraclostridium bifermentans]